MKKSKNRVLSLILSVLMATLLMLCGCNFGEGQRDVDKNKSQLNIGAFGGGYGTAYLQDLKERFEEYYAEYSFEEGKKGVQVWYLENKDRYTADTFVDTISSDTNDIVYLSGDKTADFVENNSIVEITDVVTSSLSDYGEEGTIEGKLRQTQIDHFSFDGKYYSLPYTESSLGLIFDVDVFEDYELFIAKNGSPTERLVNSGSSGSTEYTWVGATGERSAGPDGRYETEHDNGLPATLDDFKALIDKIYSSNIDSIIWTGQFADTYSTFLAKSFQINYHGVEESMIMFDGGGETGRPTKLITNWNGDEPVIEYVNVGLNNIKDLGKQAGMYYGLKMFEIILESGTVSDYVPQELSHVRTQEKFLVSNHRFSETPIAFMIDGTWWENEANEAGIFKANEEEFGLGRADRRYAYFSMPNATIAEYQAKVTANNDGDSTNDINGTILGGGGSIVINSKISKTQQQIAKEFIKFSMTDESLRRFTVNTSLPAPFKYEMGDSAYLLTHFARSYMDVYTNSDILYEYYPNELRHNNALLDIYNILTYQWSTDGGGTDLSKFADICPTKINAEDYFKGVYRRLGGI